MQASTSVQHMVLPCHWSQRNQMLPDLVRCYGACGRTIIFTETKRDANDLLNVLSEGYGARALHGDIPQVRLQAAALISLPHWQPNRGMASSPSVHWSVKTQLR